MLSATSPFLTACCPIRIDLENGKIDQYDIWTYMGCSSLPCETVKRHPESHPTLMAVSDFWRITGWPVDHHYGVNIAITSIPWRVT